MTVRLVWKRVAGIEPAWPAWKAGALPLSYTRAQYREKLSYGMQKDKHIFSSQRIFLSSCHVFHLLLTILADLCNMCVVICGRRSMVGRVLPKHETRVRFPSPVLKRAAHRLLFFLPQLRQIKAYSTHAHDKICNGMHNYNRQQPFCSQHDKIGDCSVHKRAGVIHWVVSKHECSSHHYV